MLFSCCLFSKSKKLSLKSTQIPRTFSSLSLYVNAVWTVNGHGCLCMQPRVRRYVISHFTLRASGSNPVNPAAANPRDTRDQGGEFNPFHTRSRNIITLSRATTVRSRWQWWRAASDLIYACAWDDAEITRRRLTRKCLSPNLARDISTWYSGETPQNLYRDRNIAQSICLETTCAYGARDWDNGSI